MRCVAVADGAGVVDRSLTAAGRARLVLVDRQEVRVDSGLRLLLQERHECRRETEIVVDAVARASREPSAQAGALTPQSDSGAFRVVQVQHVGDELEDLSLCIGVRRRDVADDQILD